MNDFDKAIYLERIKTATCRQAITTILNKVYVYINREGIPYYNDTKLPDDTTGLRNAHQCLIAALDSEHGTNRPYGETLRTTLAKLLSTERINGRI